MTGFFLGVLASIVAAEIYLWLPIARRNLEARLWQGADPSLVNNWLYRIASRTSGTGIGVVFAAIALAVKHASGSRRLVVKTLLLTVEIGLMVVAVWAAFRLRYADGVPAGSLMTPIVVMVPLQLVALRAIGIGSIFNIARWLSLAHLRLIILAFLLSTLPLWMWAGIDLESFQVLGIPRSVLIINLDLVLMVYVGLASTIRLIQATREASLVTPDAGPA